MVWQVGDVFSLVVESLYPGNVTGFNQFFYQAAQWDGITPPLTTASQQLAEEWITYVAALWTAANWSGTRLVGIRVFDLFEDADIYEAALDLAGVNAFASDALPPYVAVRCEAKVARRFRRDVSNRFSGLPEAWNSNGLFAPPPPELAKWQALADGLVTALTAVYSGTESILFRRVAIRRVKAEVNGKTVYRLPTTLGEADPVTVSEGRLERVLTTQGGRRL